MTGQEVGKIVADHLKQKRIDQLKRAGITFGTMAAELAAMARSSINDYVSVAEGGEVQAIPLDQIPATKLKAVKRIREKTVITESKDGERIYKTSQLEYELYDKLDAVKYGVKLLGEEPAQDITVSHEASQELIDQVDKIMARGADILLDIAKGHNGNGK